MSRGKYSYGMTLIELLLVISILAISLSLIFPRVKRSDYHLMTSSRILRDDIRNARYMNMVEGKSYKIILEPYQYRIVENSKELKVVKLEKNLRMSHNFTGGQIGFRYTGSPSAGGTIKIFDNKLNIYTEITVVPDTGRVLLKNEIFKGHK
ncbi:prepilin-type N-terminal cleavage/methylation domain-containing protein [Proteiniborus ethanoligenes]|uniref:Prepilin-type N-terminal cleavage/methylation domain-containing protein n=1 Tax=Proteiniborus ethanoligenes TaxID=415015 RepID=A0A1H3K738_9FIRM|nr:type II secretion system protein [Proteiniborus ethanoligenes]SDY48006.1 prepilin-type N-terminal cleavage/methylation domain-containing protein [Proteiniborus ethanoligenes]